MTLTFLNFLNFQRITLIFTRYLNLEGTTLVLQVGLTFTNYLNLEVLQKFKKNDIFRFYAKNHIEILKFKIILEK